jgi:hypothetical protein
MMMMVKMDREYDFNLRPPTGLLFIPQMIMSMENYGEMILTGEFS